MGEEAWGGDWARKANMVFGNDVHPGVGEDTRDGGLVGDLSTLVGKVLGGGENGGENGGRVGELAAEELSSAASSWSRGTGDSVGEGLLTGEKV